MYTASRAARVAASGPRCTRGTGEDDARGKERSRHSRSGAEERGTHTIVVWHRIIRRVITLMLLWSVWVPTATRSHPSVRG